VQPAELQFPPEATERVGRTLRGKWRLDTLLDVGGMAAVYSGTHRNGSRGAIKILHRERSLVPEIAARFLREGYIANAVGHPGVVRVLDDDVDDDGSVFLVMELLEGSPLHERAASSGGRLGVDEVRMIADQVLEVLAAAHDHGIVHRDIKPENIFVTKDGCVKLLDFGIARCAIPDGKVTTMNGAPLGTPAFMPPEQARGRTDLVGPASDLWALGATMFTLLTGEIVHPGDTPAEIIVASFSRPARSLATALPGAPAWLCNVVDRAMELEVGARWPDARAMREALHHPAPTSYRRVEAEAPTLTGDRAIIPSPPRRIPGSPRQWALALLAAVVSYAGVTALAGAIAGS
jgi:serine/threonine-protein kinase